MLSIVLGLHLLAAGDSTDAPALPVVEDVAWGPFRDHCRTVLAALEKLEGPLPPDILKRVNALLDARDGGPDQAAAVQKVLDRHCLVRVHINPESRVKAARGPRRAELVRGQGVLMLVKVHNEAGVRAALTVSSEQAVRGDGKDESRWVELGVVGKPLPRALSGRRLEYRVLRLTARQAGKREAALRFDVGQGTQDLGFRAEVPILFTVVEKRTR